jgi:hypothetical protein
VFLWTFYVTPRARFGFPTAENGSTLDAMNVGGIAQNIYKEAGLSADEPVLGGAAAIAVRLGLAIYRQPHAAEEAAVASWGGQQRIVLRRGLELPRANFLVAQMLVRIAGVEPGDERAAAAWLVAPPELVRQRYHQVGADLAEIARPFAVTRTAAALRLGEVVGLDIAIVGQRAIHRRGRRFSWLSDDQLRALAAKRTTKSVRRVSLRDDGKAVALMAS